VSPVPPGRSRAPFARSWWGQAWIEALEQRARLDPNRLPRGRTYARQSRVGALTIEAGEARAPVLGSQGSAYRVALRVRRFDEVQWDLALDAIAARAAHAAALLDGELTPEIVADLAAVGLDLLPGPGDLATTCSCPDRANPCKHAAAVCYLVAIELDADPFDLLLLRGRSREDVLAGLRARRAAAGGAPTAAADGRRIDPGLPAADVWVADGTGEPRPPLPAPPPLPTHPGPSSPVHEPPPVGSGIDLATVADLAADAAARAVALLTGGDAGLDLDAPADLARRAAVAAHAGPRAVDRLAASAGVHPADLAGLAETWEHGGRDGVVAVGSAATPPPEALDAARSGLQDAGWTTRVTGDGDLTVLASPARLRWGPGDQWYRLERRHDEWTLVAPPDTDAVALLGSAPPRRRRGVV
jgi:uncharacterized Zn finger protein